MHSVLFVASIPPERHDMQWGSFLAFVDQKLKLATDVLRLSENVWIVNAQKATGPLGHLIAIAENQGIAYGILPFERAPEWLPGGFDPKTIQGRNV